MGPINGFCLIGRRSIWQKHAHAAPAQTFPCPLDILPSGKKNPWPTMAGQEDWLNDQVKKEGGRSGTLLSSFGFHYRAVTRGN